MINLAILIAICVLWVIGGQGKRRLRLNFVPPLIALKCVLGLSCPLLTKIELFFALSATFQLIRLGYGNYSPEDDPKPSFLASLTHDRGGWWIRAIWGFLVASLGALPWVICTHHWLIYLAYVLGNSILNFLVSRLKPPVLLTDILVSAGLASLIFIK